MRKEFNNTIKWFFEDEEDTEPCMLWEYAYTARMRENLAFDEYLRYGAEAEKRYVKKNSKKIALRLIQEGNEKQLVKLLRTGLVSKVTLKVLLKELEEMPVAQAYVLDQIGLDMISLNLAFRLSRVNSSPITFLTLWEEASSSV